jgi:hypothetical protein
MIVWSFWTYGRGGYPENWRIEKKWTEQVYPGNISYSMQMETTCWTGLLLGTNRGCITTNPNQSVLQCNGNIPLHLQPKSSKFKVSPSAGRVMLTVFWDSQGVVLAHFQKRGEDVNSALYCEVLLKLQDGIRRNVQANWQEGHCLVMTIPDPIQP